MGKLRSLFRLAGRANRRHQSSSSSSSYSSLLPYSSASDAPPPAAGDELERVFRKFDTNGDGKISSSELAEIFASLGCKPTDEDVARMMAAADTDGDGFISLEEFIELNAPSSSGCGSHEGVQEADILGAFEVFDLDRNGVISAEELARVLRGIGEAATEAQCRRMIQGVDLDGDGQVSYEEFRAMMTSSSTGASGALAAVAKAADQF